MGFAYYNEFDPKAAAWLRELIKHKHIADGVVDERSILDVEASDLKDFKQCHFFAGIGGWSYALRLAGVPDDFEVWTGSPPCQPFSVAGKQKGKDDERHLSPKFASLVREARPKLVFGEQVASKDVFGPVAKKTGRKTEKQPQWAWLDDLFAEMEAAHYACAASDIPAAGVGAPHLRQRTFFGATRLENPFGIRWGRWGDGHNESKERGACAKNQIERRLPLGHWSNCEWAVCKDGTEKPIEPGTFPLADGFPARVDLLRGYGNAIVPQAAAVFVRSFLEALD